MDRHVSVSITPSTILKILLILFGAYLLYYLRDLVLVVLTAVVLASAIEPGVAFFSRHRFPRLLAVITMYLLVFGVFFGVIYLLFPPLLDEAERFALLLPQYLETIDFPSSFGSASDTAKLLIPGDSPSSFFDWIFAIRETFANTSEGAIRLVSSFFGGVFSFVLVIVLSFYFAVQETGVDDFLRLITPARHEEYVIGLWHRSQRKIGLWMQGQLLLSLIIALLAYLGLVILGVPYALLLGLFAAIAELIPVFGALLALIPAVAVAFADGGAALAFIVAGLFIVIHQFESNLIYPLVVKKIVGVPPLLVILALIAGWQIAGFLGVLLSVPVAAAVQEFVSDVDRRRRVLRETPSV